MKNTRTINDLILYGIFKIEQGGGICDFEKLIEKCFSLFPKEFSFKSLKQWPDARKIDRPLRTLRDKKLISGNPITFFKLTTNGKKEAGQIAKTFSQKKLL